MKTWAGGNPLVFYQAQTLKTNLLFLQLVPINKKFCIDYMNFLPTVSISQPF